MFKLMNYIFLLTVVVAVSLFSGLTISQADEALVAAPSFSAKGTAGQDWSLDGLKGKVVVLEWFNPGCPFVKAAYKRGSITALQREITGAGGVWLTVNSTNPGHRDFLPVEKFKELREAWGVASSDYILDSTGGLGRTFEAKSTPTIIVIDQNGRIVYQGALDNQPMGDSVNEGFEFYTADAARAALQGKLAPIRSTKAYGCSVKY